MVLDPFSVDVSNASLSTSSTARLLAYCHFLIVTHLPGRTQPFVVGQYSNMPGHGSHLPSTQICSLLQVH